MTDISTLPVAATNGVTPRKADPQREYAAGSPHLPWLVNMVAALPPWIDAKTRDFGDDFYERMLLDPQVSSCLHLWKMGVLAQPVKAVCAVKEQTDPQYARAREVCDYVQRAIDRVAGFRSQKLYNLLDGAAYGNKVAEMVLERASFGPDKGQLTLKTLKIKHRRTLGFIVDAFMNLVGFVAVIPGESWSLNFISGMAWATVPNKDNFLPREKFVVFTFRAEDEDPRGVSLLSSVYPAWWGKLQLYPEYLKYLAQFADPSLWGTTAEAAQDEYPRNAAGQLTGAPPVPATLAMLSVAQQIRNGSVVVFPNGATLNALEMQGNGEPFLNAYEFFDNQIAKGILGSTLATEQSKFGTRAQSQVHQDAVGLGIGHGRNLLEEMLERDLFTYLIVARFGPDALEYCPKASLGEVQQEDMGVMATAAAALLKTGQITPSQYVYISTEMLGFPPPTLEEMEVIQAQFQASAQPQDPNAAGGTDPWGDPAEGDNSGDKAAFSGQFEESEHPRQQGGRFGSKGKVDQPKAARGGAEANQPGAAQAGKATASVDHGPGAKEAATKFFGREVSDHDFQEMLGAPAGAKVTVDEGSGGNLIFHVTHDLYQDKHIQYAVKLADGRSFMQMELYHLKDSAPKGMGTKAFGKMVDKGRELGMSAIHIPLAARTSVMVGYYVWPRFGADQDIPEDKRKDLPTSLSGAKRLSDLMKTDEGRRFWQEKGDTIKCTFDLDKGSVSSQVWSDYLAEKGQK